MVGSKFFDTGRGRGKLIASFLREKARVFSKRGLLFGVGHDLLLSRRGGLGRAVEIGASGRRERQPSHDERNNGSMPAASKYARRAGYKAASRR